MMKYNVLVFEGNTTGRDFIVGDIHGHFDQLLLLCEQVWFDPEQGDRLFCTGDFVDRGPKCLETLNIIRNPWCHSVIGNHEQFVVGHASSDPIVQMTSQLYHRQNGGQWFYDLADESQATPQQLATILVEEYISRMPYVIVVGEGRQRFNIVHAEFYRANGLVSDYDIDNWTFNPDEIDKMTWGRALIRNPMGTDGYRPLQHGLSPTYVGHTPVDVVCTHQNQIYIDTGAASAGPKHPERGLTIVDHAARQYWTYKPESNTVVTYTIPPFR